VLAPDLYHDNPKAIDVISMVAVTAKPYAAARFPLERKEMTSRRQAAARNQLMTGK
jgi:hypothetical protein